MNNEVLVMSRCHMAYEFNGAVHVLPQDEYESAERSGKSSWYAYATERSECDAPVTGAIHLMDNRPKPTEPGAFPAYRPIPDRQEWRVLSTREEAFVQAFRPLATYTVLAWVIGIHEGAVKSFCRKKGLYGPKSRVAVGLTVRELQHEYELSMAQFRDAA